MLQNINNKKRISNIIRVNNSLFLFFLKYIDMQHVSLDMLVYPTHVAMYMYTIFLSIMPVFLF